jgi:hypothetical protein
VCVGGCAEPRGGFVSLGRGLSCGVVWAAGRLVGNIRPLRYRLLGHREVGPFSRETCSIVSFALIFD